MKINLGTISIEISVDEYIELVNLEGIDELLENLSSLELASNLTQDSLCEKDDSESDEQERINNRIFGIKYPDDMGNHLGTINDDEQVKIFMNELLPGLKDKQYLQKNYLF